MKGNRIICFFPKSSSGSPLSFGLALIRPLILARLSCGVAFPFPSEIMLYNNGMHCIINWRKNELRGGNRPLFVPYYIYIYILHIYIYISHLYISYIYITFIYIYISFMCYRANVSGCLEAGRQKKYQSNLKDVNVIRE